MKPTNILITHRDGSTIKHSNVTVTQTKHAVFVLSQNKLTTYFGEWYLTHWEHV